MKRSTRYNSKGAKEGKEKRRALEKSQLKAVQEVLPVDVIEKICIKEGYSYRKRLLTPEVTMYHMLQAAVHREGSFQSAWHSIGKSGLSGSLSKARKRIPLEVWKKVDEWVVKKVGIEFAGKEKWRGHRIIGVDGSCISMSDKALLEKEFGKSGSKEGQSRFPIARVVFVFTLKTMIAVAHRMSSYRTSENGIFSEIIKQLKRGDVFIGDRRYAGAKLYVEYHRAGIEFITRIHHRTNMERLGIEKELSKNDYVVRLPIPLMYRKKDSTLPEYICIRIIKVTARVRGKKELFWIATSLLEASKYPKQDITMLYKKRWKIEGLVEELKIKLHADILRSKTVQGVYKETYARVIAFNLIHWLILKASQKHRKNVQRVSVCAAVRLVAVYSIKMSVVGARKVSLFFKELLCHIANSIVPYRQGRLEPRMKKRDQKHYPQLKISREQWRQLNVATS